MADSGYQGIQHDVRAILPIKKLKNRQLSQVQIDYRRISSKRIIVENVFSRLQQWKILQIKWKGKFKFIEKYKIVFSVCCPLTNLLI